MLLVQQITSDALQQQNLVLDNGSTVLLQLYFRPMQYGWFINQLTWNNFTIYGMRICNSPNLLLQYSNQIPFGLACYSTNNLEPQLAQSFSSGNSNLYILSQAEVQQYLEFLASGNIN